jgi:hypothetical protein
VEGTIGRRVKEMSLQDDRVIIIHHPDRGGARGGRGHIRGEGGCRGCRGHLLR